MKRGRGEDEDIEGVGEALKIFRHPKGGSKKNREGLRKFVYFKTNSLKMEPLARRGC